MTLQDGCAQFEKQAAAMKNKFWMENLKAIIAGSVVGLIVLGLIYWKFFMDQPQQGPPPGKIAHFLTSRLPSVETFDIPIDTHVKSGTDFNPIFP